MSKDEALKLALEALELHGQQYPHMVKGYCLDAITAIKEALAQPEQEPVAYTGNGTAGREADVRPTGFFFQADKRQPKQEPVAWLDGPHLVMREDWRDRSNYKGPYVGADRAIPDSWVPVLYTTPPQNGYAEEKNLETRAGAT